VARNRAAFIALLAAVLLLGQLVLGWADPEPVSVVAAPPPPLLEVPGVPAAITTIDDGVPDTSDTSDTSGTSAESETGAAAGADPVSSSAEAAEPSGGSAGPGTEPVAVAGPEIVNPVPVIFDTDIVNAIDDSLALALLHGYRGLGLVDLLAVTLSTDGLGAAAYVDAINTFHHAPDTPIGGPMALRAAPATSFPAIVAIETDRFPRDLPLHATTGTGLDDAVTVLRRHLAAGEDHSVVIICTGPATNLARLLSSPPDDVSPMTGSDLVAAKVSTLSIVTEPADRSRHETPETEHEVTTDVAAAQQVFTDWPTPIVVVGEDVGLAADFPIDAVTANGRAWNDPVARAIDRDRSTRNDRSPTVPDHDLAAVTYAIGRPAPPLSPGPAGRVEVRADGTTTFVADPAGLHRRLDRPDASEAAAITGHQIEVLTTGRDG
jgi:inosine-uridine nucleoside N-ribohydrolase